MAAFDTLHLRLLEVAEATLSPDIWNYRGQFSRFWILYVNADPGAHIVTHGQDEAIQPNRAFLIPPGTFQERMYCTEVIRCFYAIFDCVGAFQSTLRALIPRPIYLNHPDPALTAATASLREQFLAQHRSVSSEDVGLHCATKALLYRFFACFLQELPEERLAQAQARSLTRAAIAPALERIEGSYGEPCPVAQLADTCAMSVGHFTRTFHRLTGQTPNEYLLETRIKAAAEALLLTDTSIEAIATRCGFGSRYYFTRMFARRVGIPPAEYRRSPTPYLFLEPTAAR